MVLEAKKSSVLSCGIYSDLGLEALDSSEAASELGKYFQQLVDARQKYKQNSGYLEVACIGNSLVALFSSPETLEDNVWTAVQTAVEMRLRLAEYNEGRRSVGRPAIKTGIGINSDLIFTEGASSDRTINFAAIGDGAKLASRLEETSKMYGTDIVIGDNVYKSCADRILVRELDFITVKENAEPVKIYELLGIKKGYGDLGADLTPEQNAIVEAYKKGRELYYNRQFMEAMAAFAKVLDIDKGNTAAYLHMDRCHNFLMEPPGDDWDGVWNLASKW